jgi:SAM-dependent methyltransferase
MHENNKKWLTDLKTQYPDSFKDCRVLEIGSRNVNGTVRDFFTNCEFVGIDMEAGRGVDVVDKYPIFDKQFDTLISFNTYEHDFEWKQTLKHNLQWLRKGGMFFASFGSEGNEPHSYPVWRLIPHTEFINYCLELGLTVIDSFFEEERYGPNMKGAFNIICKL